MKQEQKEIIKINDEPRRRLSPWRLLLALVILACIGVGGFLGLQQWHQTIASGAYSPWFASYVDVTATPQYGFEQLGSTTTHTVVLSFIVSSKDNACTPTWGTAYTLTQASDQLDLDRRIARLRQQGGNIAISFGGLLNDELSLNCTDQTQLLNAYSSVINRYSIDTIDMDIEGRDLSNTEAMKRRAAVLATLQKNMRANKKNLAIWLTLPVSPQGLTEDGTNAVAIMLSNGVDLSGVNVMTMDYAGSLQNNESMEQASEQAITETVRQLGILYKNAGINLTTATVWSKIGATPMIGQNDITDEIFTLDNAKAFNRFASARGIGRMSMWSANRDIQCGENYVDVKIVSDSCSGIKQDKLAFTTLLSQNFNGELKDAASVVTSSEPSSDVQVADDPKISPYQIWQKTGAYLAGTKVVWHHNVYQAKWWTQGDIPDNPVLQSYQTPWQLIGPVLPGETPIPQPTLPPGTYPDWSGDTAYNAGQRVLFEGIPYQAKWWTKGDSPAAASANPDVSPWVPLTQQQVTELLQVLKTTQATASAKPKK